MAEANETPRQSPDSTISPAILEKFSKGRIQLGEGMMIDGEGEERKITITLTPDDPAYLEYSDRAKRDAQFTSNTVRVIGGSQEFDNKMIAVALAMRGNQKKGLDINAFASKINKYRGDNERNFLKRTEETSGTETTEQLTTDMDNFNDLLTYTYHLFTQNALETILPEQQIGQK